MKSKIYKIFVADDDKTLLNIECAYIKQYMKQKHFSVSITRETESFPTLFELNENASNYDLIILDNQMPFLNGKHLLHSLLPQNPSLLNRVVFVSADASRIQDYFREHAPQHHIHSLNKPFSYRNFKTLADKILAQSSEIGTSHAHAA